MRDYIKRIMERTQAYVPDVNSPEFLDKFAEVMVEDLETEITNWLGYHADGEHEFAEGFDTGLRMAATTITGMLDTVQ